MAAHSELIHWQKYPPAAQVRVKCIFKMKTILCVLHKKKKLTDKRVAVNKRPPAPLAPAFKLVSSIASEWHMQNAPSVLRKHHKSQFKVIEQSKAAHENAKR